MFAETHSAVLLVLLVAVAGPLLVELPVGFRVPAVVLEVVLGIIIGPQVLGLVHFDGIVAAMFALSSIVLVVPIKVPELPTEKAGKTLALLASPSD